MDVTELFTEAELKRAEEMGITVVELIDGHIYGFTFEEMVKIHPLKQKNKGKKLSDISFVEVVTIANIQL